MSRESVGEELASAGTEPRKGETEPGAEGGDDEQITGTMTMAVNFHQFISHEICSVRFGAHHP